MFKINRNREGEGEGGCDDGMRHGECVRLSRSVQTAVRLTLLGSLSGRLRAHTTPISHSSTGNLPGAAASAGTDAGVETPVRSDSSCGEERNERPDRRRRQVALADPRPDHSDLR